MSALVFLLAILTGWFGAEFCCADLRPRWAARMLQAGLAIGGGIGIASIAFFVLMLTGAATGLGVAAVDTSLAALAASLVWKRKRSAQAEHPAGRAAAFRWNWILAAALGFALLLACTGLAEIGSGMPAGQWDAWAIWNAQARYLAGSGATWHNGLVPVSFGHPDYPLLLPGFIASVWKCSGEIDPAVPLYTAFLFFAAVLAVLGATLTLLRGLSSALLAGLVMAASSAYLLQAPTQYADVPISFFCVAALALILLTAVPGLPDPRPLVAGAGLCAGFAAWTKNEGVMMAGMLLAAYLIVQWWSSGFRAVISRWTWMLAGALPGLMLYAIFRIFLAPASDPYLQQSAAQALHKFGEAARYGAIAKAFLDEALNLGTGIANPLLIAVVLAVALRFRIDPPTRPALAFAALSLALIFGGYWAAYVATPSDLNWHLQTSAGRLCAQIWPGAVLLLFLVLKAPEDTAKP